MPTVILTIIWYSITHSLFHSRLKIFSHARTHTHTHPFNGPFPGLPRWADTRKVKPIWILLKQETVSGSGISWAICKSATRSRQITTPASHHSVFTRRIPFLPPNQQRQSTEGLKPFSANPSHCSPSFLLLKYSLHGFPGLFTVISEHICFLLLVFLFLHFLVVGSVR